MNPQDIIHECKVWLSESVLPLWTQRGIDPSNGSFVESLSFEGQPQKIPRRAMVQARQIYSYNEAIKMKLINKSEGSKIVENAVNFLMEKYSLPSGAFIHSVHPDGTPENKQSELYTQAFVLFGLAQGYEVLKRSEIKDRAKNLLRFLNVERKAPHGGYTEIKDGKVVFQSNPHMHLFESMIAWMKVDSTDPEWKKVATEVFELCRNKFVDREAGVIAEYFDENWNPLREDGRFVAEPGHQFEWAWLMAQYETISDSEVGTLPRQLYERAEKYGVKPTGETVDEIWSDFKIKKSTSRFWPQSERIKAALEVGSTAGADQAMTVLLRYLKTPVRGLWYDTLLETGRFNDQAPKASSLYHIINAMSEYTHKRLSLKN